MIYIFIWSKYTELSSWMQIFNSTTTSDSDMLQLVFFQDAWRYSNYLITITDKENVSQRHQKKCDNFLYTNRTKAMALMRTSSLTNHT